MGPKFKAVVGVGVACLLAGAVPAATAQANEGTTTTGKHCVVEVTNGKTTCYQSFRDAVAKATGGRITDAPSTPSTAVADSRFEDRLNALGAESGEEDGRANVVVSIEYDWAYYQDDVGSLTASAPGGCVANGGADWQLANVGEDWNDRISSFRGYADCNVDHFEHADFDGASTGWLADVGSMADHTSLNNLTSSIRWG